MPAAVRPLSPPCRLSREPEHQSQAGGRARADLHKVFVWLDVLALPQQFLGA